MGNALNPTAANIISSLGIKGATVGENLPGYVPVLDDSGHINANLVPANAAQLAIPAISNAAFVDPYTAVKEFDTEGRRLRTGSIVAPFKSLEEAAANFQPTEEAKLYGYVAFVLAPGTYSDDSIQFKNSPSSVFLIGLGECRFGSSTVAMFGMSSGADLVFQNIRTEYTISVIGSPSVTCLGRTRINQLLAGTGNTSKLKLSPESRVSSTDIGDVSYLLEAANVGYARRGSSSPEFPEGTVGKELETLGRRKIRIANITADSSGFDIDSTTPYIDLSAESSGGEEIFDMRSRDAILVRGINQIFEKGEDISAVTVTADTVTADIIEARELRMDSIALGGYRLEIDNYGYLVVADSAADPVKPLDCVVLIRDTGDRDAGAVYVLGISDGRMFIERAEDYEDSPSDSSSYDEIHDSLEICDSGQEYTVTVENGRLTITRGGAT